MTAYNRDRLERISRELAKPLPDPTPLICAALILACVAILLRIAIIW